MLALFALQACFVTFRRYFVVLKRVILWERNSDIACVIPFTKKSPSYSLSRIVIQRKRTRIGNWFSFWFSRTTRSVLHAYTFFNHYVISTYIDDNAIFSNEHVYHFLIVNHSGLIDKTWRVFLSLFLLCTFRFQHSVFVASALSLSFSGFAKAAYLKGGDSKERL